MSKIINIKKGVFVMAFPISQSDTVLKEDEVSKVGNIITELNNSIEADINSAILQDMSNMYKSNVNQKFINSF